MSPRMHVTPKLHGAKSLTQSTVLSASHMVHQLQRRQYKNVVDVFVITRGVGRVATGPCLSTSDIARVGFAAALGILTCLPYEDPSQTVQHRDIDPYWPKPMTLCHRLNDSFKEPLYAKATTEQSNTTAKPFMQYLGVLMKEDMTTTTHENASYVVSGEQFKTRSLSCKK